MIVRIFRAIVHDGKSEAFASFFLGEILPMIRSKEGLLSAKVGLPHESSPCEFTMIMHWRDLDSIKAFAGGDWREAMILPEEAHLLKETHVHHFVAVDD
jgi:quinol monooxygenase YgiN